ncbi:hypothetical protein EB796_015235 [Bugula neritina]|uniref:Uncharacterized protein n=1 Tax=Bugula neritina TaxID=10212 RepID=A0A7J7JLC2_BUGNE|nr:hypothetical protein EB796_015235 [Bugula neritina]
MTNICTEEELRALQFSRSSISRVNLISYYLLKVNLNDVNDDQNDNDMTYLVFIFILTIVNNILRAIEQYTLLQVDGPE